MRRRMKLLYICRFWIKSYLYKVIPISGGYGYYRYLHRYTDPNYDFKRDKHPVRYKHSGQEGWRKQKEQGITYRDYTNYEEYVIHQKQKFDEMLKIEGGFSMKSIVKHRLKFYARFKYLYNILSPTASIVCLGARQGTEVEVFRDLGFKNVYGIDLNPGPNNPYVREGDFMKLDNPTSSIDLIYTNCLDHAFDLRNFFIEHARVIKEDGYVLYDVAIQIAGGGAFEAVSWEDEEDIFKMMLDYFNHVIHVETERDWKWILMQGKRKVKSDT